MSNSPWDEGLLPEPALPLASTFEGFLQLAWETLEDQSAEVTFRIRDDLRQPLGLMHGGIYSSVAETVASVATMAALSKSDMTASGLSNTASFLRPITTGTVRVTARCRYRDEREWLWSHEFHDDQDRLCALVDVWMAVRPKPA